MTPPQEQTWRPLRLEERPNLIVLTPLHSQPGVAQLLGLMLEAWSALQAELAVSLGHLLEGSMEGAHAVIYSLNSEKTRLDMVKGVARAVMPDGPEKKGFIYLIERLSDLAMQRNAFVHGEIWHNDEADGLAVHTIRPQASKYRTVAPLDERALKDHVVKVRWREAQLATANAVNPLQYSARRLRAPRSQRR